MSDVNEKMKKLVEDFKFKQNNLMKKWMEESNRILEDFKLQSNNLLSSNEGEKEITYQYGNKQFTKIIKDYDNEYDNYLPLLFKLKNIIYDKVLDPSYYLLRLMVSKGVIQIKELQKCLNYNKQQFIDFLKKEGVIDDKVSWKNINGKSTSVNLFHLDILNQLIDKNEKNIIDTILENEEEYSNSIDKNFKDL